MVTGGTSGIGFALAVALMQRGLARATVERFGRVDLVCNNAGVLCEQGGG